MSKAHGWRDRKAASSLKTRRRTWSRCRKASCEERPGTGVRGQTRPVPALQHVTSVTHEPVLLSSPCVLPIKPTLSLEPAGMDSATCTPRTFTKTHMWVFVLCSTAVFTKGSWWTSARNGGSWGLTTHPLPHLDIREAPSGQPWPYQVECGDVGYKGVDGIVPTLGKQRGSFISSVSFWLPPPVPDTSLLGGCEHLKNSPKGSSRNDESV